VKIILTLYPQVTMAEKLKDEGNERFKDGEFEKAIVSYSKAIAIDDLNHLLYANRAACYLSLDKYEDARSDSKKCIALDPSFVKAYLRLANAERYLGNKEEALRVVQEGISKFPAGSAKKAKGLYDFKKLEKELKHELNPKSRDDRQAMLSSEGSGDDSSVQVLGEKVINAKWKLTKLNRELQFKQRELQEKQLIMTNLGAELSAGARVPMYRTMGKGFLLQSAEELVESINKEATNAEKEFQSLKKGQDVLTRNLKEAEKVLNDHLAKRQA